MGNPKSQLRKSNSEARAVSGEPKKPAASKPPAESPPSKTANPYVSSPLYNILHVFERAQDQWAARYAIILSVVLLKSAVGLGSFSGQGQKPINGDFEAQRHWMELTINLPITKWYFYDLPYWGLDYPPLTAFHSWFLGRVGSVIDSKWFRLGVSRGLETSQLKTYMRLTALISDLVVYTPAVMQLTYFLAREKRFSSRIHQLVVLTLILCQPGLILIDNGHFQYNSVMLGLFLLSVLELMKGNLVIASVWFVGSILFKQMALYYSPFIFFFILSKLFTPKKSVLSTFLSLNVGKLIVVGLTVALTIAAVVTPFILGSEDNSQAITVLQQILIRMFPFDRGLFEDKVANFWCTSNILVKYTSRFTNEQLKTLSLALTLAGMLPPCLMCFWKNIRRSKPPADLIIYGFSATAWAFYLFSFQVHEKTVLVPLIPSTFLLLSSDRDTVAIVQWINNIATFSLFPLLKKDGLVLQYITTLALINWLIGGFTIRNNLLWPGSSLLFKLIIPVSYLAVAAVHIVDGFLVPPPKYPDLWVIANTTVSFGAFGIFYLWLLYKIYIH